MVLIDSYGRPLLNLRVAVTQRCNLRCPYCHVEGEARARNHKEITADEVVRLVKIAVKLGISEVKLTGGEPLIRDDILEIVEGIAAIAGLSSLSMTTNGTMLAALAEELHAMGLKRVNVSIPTLNAGVYNKLTGGNVESAVEGVKAAIKAGFHQIKLNMLILNGVNDHDVPEMIEFAKSVKATLQLMELERINVDDAYYLAHYKPLDEHEAMLRRKAVGVEVREFMHNRNVYYLPDVTVEVVRPTENTEFCKHCTRLRLTSDGKLKPCLMRNDNLVDILTPMRDGADDQELVELFKQANRMREPYNKADRVLIT